MLVRAPRQGDVEVNGVKKALFEGQVYDLPPDLVAATGWLVSLDPPRVGEPAPPVEEERPRRGRRAAS